MQNKIVFLLFSIAILVAPVHVYAAPKTPDALETFYTNHPELKQIFDTKTKNTKPGANTEFINLNDWATQFGWREYAELKAYAPKGIVPVRKAESTPPPELNTAGYIVLDRKTGLILNAKKPGLQRPIASLTKLMTAEIILNQGVSKNKIITTQLADRVGGSALNVKAGTKISVDDLFYATFLASANDAANTLARATGKSKTNFIKSMNARAASLGLIKTTFKDPSGIDEGNVSTPREFALLAATIFDRRDVRRYTTTATRRILLLPRGVTATLKNTNGLLWKEEHEDVFVTAGKTGYLGPEYGWNIAVSMKDTYDKTKPELLLVLMGTGTLKETQDSVKLLASWAWNNHDWKKL